MVHRGRQLLNISNDTVAAWIESCRDVQAIIRSFQEPVPHINKLMAKQMEDAQRCFCSKHSFPQRAGAYSHECQVCDAPLSCEQVYLTHCHEPKLMAFEHHCK